ncbi:MAG: hypothetical protein IIU03_04130 [Bacteroidales bacterium]|nr:hypothetical protein [Bacteroidales bacterium]
MLKLYEIPDFVIFKRNVSKTTPRSILFSTMFSLTQKTPKCETVEFTALSVLF